MLPRSAARLALWLSLLAGTADGGPTVTITRSRGGSVVETRVVTLSNLGQADHVEISGTGMAAVEVDPAFRADGTVSGLDLTVGGDTTSLDFAANGTVFGRWADRARELALIDSPPASSSGRLPAKAGPSGV